jgi:hypothetical protein
VIQRSVSSDLLLKKYPDEEKINADDQLLMPVVFALILIFTEHYSRGIGEFPGNRRKIFRRY